MRSDMSDDLHIRMVLNGDESAYRYFITEYKDMAFTVAIYCVLAQPVP